MKRYAVVDRAPMPSIVTIQRYLPSNYTATYGEHCIFIQGEDVAGWTLDGYVIPRLITGGIRVRELGELS